MSDLLTIDTTQQTDPLINGTRIQGYSKKQEEEDKTQSGDQFLIFGNTDTTRGAFRLISTQLGQFKDLVLHHPRSLHLSYFNREEMWVYLDAQKKYIDDCFKMEASISMLEMTYSNMDKDHVELQGDFKAEKKNKKKIKFLIKILRAIKAIL